MRRKHQRTRSGKRGGRFKYGFDTWRASRRGVNAGTVRRAGRRSRRRGRRGKTLALLAAGLLLCAAAAFLLRPAYVHSQQDKITDSLIDTFLNGGERPVFAEPNRLVLRSEEIKGSPIYLEKEYAERETVGLSPVATVMLEQSGALLPVVDGTDTVCLRYAVGCGGYPPENGMLTLYGRRIDRSDRLFSTLDTLTAGSGIVFAEKTGESRYTVSASENIEKSRLEERLAELAAAGGTELLLITAGKGGADELLLVCAVREENDAVTPEEEPAETAKPVSTPVPAPESTPTPAATAGIKTPAPSAAPAATPKATKRPARRSPSPEPTEEPTPTPSSGFTIPERTPAIQTPAPSPLPDDGEQAQPETTPAAPPSATESAAVSTPQGNWFGDGGLQ